MASIDRRKIGGLLLEHFPEMEKATSDEWHGVLNNLTGLDIGLKVPNSVAFDQWRKALVKLGYPVWGLSPEREQAIQERANEIVAIIESREEANALKLAESRITAPLKTVEELLKAPK